MHFYVKVKTIPLITTLIIIMISITTTAPSFLV
jgi:hypothetical protein